MFRRVLVFSWFSITCSALRSPAIQQHASSPHASTEDSGTLDATRELELAHARVGGAGLPVSTRMLVGNALGMPMSSSSLRCPKEMAHLEGPSGPFCIDRWEASIEHRSGRARKPWPANVPVDGHEPEVRAVSRPGVTPQGYISGAQAELACHNANKRLCALGEWLQSCQGPRETTFPYGNRRRTDACNDRTLSPPQHPVVRLFRQFAPRGTDRASMWGLEWMNDPRLFELEGTIAPTGSNPECTNEYGVYDQVGNVHEWIDDPNGTFVGGFFMDTIKNGDGCLYRTTAHDTEYHDYSTGFRCCADPASF